MEKAIEFLKIRMECEENVHREYAKIGDSESAKRHRENADALDYAISILNEGKKRPTKEGE